eukprot:TRINITY_DN22322_c0_g1_i1.p2 TRINITY_DN22322_c0_g1~~TRINITY_DN22322_c0_g1_i1.p2  ORF type:complete len:133 (-),score=20.08 TRINITY_DN22322_c0_g1_i1:55-453(-)
MRSSEGFGGVRQNIVPTVESELEDVSATWGDPGRDVSEDGSWLEVKRPGFEASVEFHPREKHHFPSHLAVGNIVDQVHRNHTASGTCILYTSDAADDLLCVDLGGRRIIKKKKRIANSGMKINLVRKTSRTE